MQDRSKAGCVTVQTSFILDDPELCTEHLYPLEMLRSYPLKKAKRNTIGQDVRNLLQEV